MSSNRGPVQQAIIVAQGADTGLRTAIGGDWKGKVSLALYLVGIASTFFKAWAGQLLFAAAAILWLVPDRRLEPSLPQPGVR